MIEQTRSSAHLDTSVLDDIRALGEDVLAEVTSLFLADAPGQLSALASAIDARDAQVAWQTAHLLKGSSLGIGACLMAQICGAVESAARGEALDSAAAHVGELCAEFQVTRLALEQQVGA